MKGNSIRQKGVVISLLNVVRMDRNLICPRDINFRKWCKWKGGERSPICVGLGIGRE